MEGNNAFIDSRGRLREFKPDEQMVDQELAKEIIKYAYEQVCWNFSCLKSDFTNFYYHTEEFCYHDLCMVTLQLNQSDRNLKKIMVRTPELIMVFHEIPDGVEFEMEELIDDAGREFDQRDENRND
ncbi:hypothetical protein FUAX_51140 (plasmid) [Fulvitalea axinellae]|uniref:Uncharacterized protein n=1 Tax=Fulvitalea axinellae TaxID=1182444 RepID=A0AAU9D5P4_9BACT|nr:hypothetical protein FUAX_51140 [Fulvitalea axinellae]